MNKEEGWTDINTNGEDNIAIGYDYITWRILLMIVMVMLKIICQKYERELKFRRKKNELK